MNKESPNIRIIDIAEMAGVSVGTVDRVYITVAVCRRKMRKK